MQCEHKKRISLCYLSCLCEAERNSLNFLLNHFVHWVVKKIYSESVNDSGLFCYCWTLRTVLTIKRDVTRGTDSQPKKFRGRSTRRVKMGLRWWWHLLSEEFRMEKGGWSRVDHEEGLVFFYRVNNEYIYFTEKLHPRYLKTEHKHI